VPNKKGASPFSAEKPYTSLGGFSSYRADTTATIAREQSILVSKNEILTMQNSAPSLLRVRRVNRSASRSRIEIDKNAQALSSASGMKQRFRFSSHHRRSSCEVSHVSGVNLSSRILFSNSDPLSGGIGVGRPDEKLGLPLGVINVRIILLGTVGGVGSRCARRSNSVECLTPYQIRQPSP